MRLRSDWLCGGASNMRPINLFPRQLRLSRRQTLVISAIGFLMCTGIVFVYVYAHAINIQIQNQQQALIQIDGQKKMIEDQRVKTSGNKLRAEQFRAVVTALQAERKDWFALLNSILGPATLPASARLSGIAFDEEARIVTINGQVSDTSALQSYIAFLRKQDLFAEVRSGALRNSGTSTETNEPVFQFTLQLYLYASQ
jgi:Tfp pilus assembly protein PilN